MRFKDGLTSGIYVSLYAKGWSGGYKEYRYGDRSSAVHDPGKRPRVSRPYMKLVGRVAEQLRVEADVLRSRWSREAETRYGLRRAIIEDGENWSVADATAAELVRRAYAALGFGEERRPSWDQGQPHYTIDEEHCLWCGSEIDSQWVRQGSRFCCAEHAHLALQNFAFETNWGHSQVGMAAYRLIRRQREEPRTCEQCGSSFRPTSAASEQRFCSRRCHYDAMIVTLPDRDCEHCGAPFRPSEVGQRFCCQDHATAALRTTPERPCACCGTMFRPSHNNDLEGGQRGIYCSKACAIEGRRQPKHRASCRYCGDQFLAKSTVGKYCCDACAQADRRTSRGWQPARLTRHVFDHYFALA